MQRRVVAESKGRGSERVLRVVDYRDLAGKPISLGALPQEFLDNAGQLSEQLTNLIALAKGTMTEEQGKNTISMLIRLLTVHELPPGVLAACSETCLVTSHLPRAACHQCHNISLRINTGAVAAQDYADTCVCDTDRRCCLRPCTTRCCTVLCFALFMYCRSQRADGSHARQQRRKHWSDARRSRTRLSTTRRD